MGVYTSKFKGSEIDAAIDSVNENVTPITMLHTWGDSVTMDGGMQNGLKDVFATATIKNCGLYSDYSFHVRRRFLSYFQDETPYKGVATYSVPSFADRQAELKNSFFVFWVGTNNLLNPTRQAKYTTDSADYLAVQPNPNFKFDNLYAKSYKSMMLDDIKEMVGILPHTNFVIVGGHGNFLAESELQKAMIEVDGLFAQLYPNNFVNLKKLVMCHHNFGGYQLAQEFTKPSLNGSVSIVLNSTTSISNGTKICVGTRDIYDLYQVSSKSGNTLTCKLVESNTEFASGDVVSASYKMTSDLGRCFIDLPTKVYLHNDVLSYQLGNMIKSATADGIHPTATMYRTIGQLIGKEIKKLKTSK